MPVFGPQREQAILDKVRAQGGEDGDAAAALYSSIMAMSRAKQHLLLHGAGVPPPAGGHRRPHAAPGGRPGGVPGRARRLFPQGGAGILRGHLPRFRAHLERGL